MTIDTKFDNGETVLFDNKPYKIKGTMIYIFPDKPVVCGYFLEAQNPLGGNLIPEFLLEKSA